MIQVLVEIIDPLVEEHISNPILMDLYPGTTIRQLGECLNLPPELTSLALVNQEIRQYDYILQDRDYVAFFSSLEVPEGDIPVLTSRLEK